MDTPFGTRFLSRMALCDFRSGQWGEAINSPFAAMNMSPSLSAVHYGQIAFEGLKAYPTQGQWHFFRPERHHTRLTLSCQRLAMPAPPWEAFLHSLKICLQDAPQDTPVYFRPVVMAWENFLGVRAASAYRFFMIACPASSYFGDNQQGLRLVTETEMARAFPGGTGDIKTPGNYAASLAAAEAAKQKGYSDVLWLDAQHHRCVEEAGAMNVFFRLGNTLVTPSLQGSILAGITRETVMELAQELGLPVQERQITMDEIGEAYGKGDLLEAFGTGTAAGIAPIREIAHKGETVFQAKLVGGVGSPMALAGSWTEALSRRLKESHYRLNQELNSFNCNVCD